MQPVIDRKRILIFLAFAYGIAIVTALVIYATGGLDNSPLLMTNLTLAGALMATFYMFAPSIANIATRLITREGWSNTHLRPNFRRGWRYYLAAWFIPPLATILGGAIFYLLFPRTFDLTLPYVRNLLALSPNAAGTNPWTVVAAQTAFALLLAPWINTLFAFGEEFGWRAYLLPKLLPLGQRKALLLMGVIWGVWHWPVIFMGYEYGMKYWGAPVVGPLLFIWFTFCVGAMLGWVAMRSDSVWPAALGHGAVNATPMLMLFFYAGQPDLLVGPTAVGIIGALGYAVVALRIFFTPHALAVATGTPADQPPARVESASVN